jgi:hypothetical protein
MLFVFKNFRKGVRLMSAKLAALVVGITVLNGAEIAQAADMARADTQKQVGITEHSKPVGPVVLTDDQMDKVTAGHLTWPGDPSIHMGSYRNSIGEIVVGLHSDVGQSSVPAPVSVVGLHSDVGQSSVPAPVSAP